MSQFTGISQKPRLSLSICLKVQFTRITEILSPRGISWIGWVHEIPRQVRGGKNVILRTDPLWQRHGRLVIRYVHSLSSAVHDAGQQQAQDDGQDQGHYHCHDVVQEIFSARGRLRRVKVTSSLQYPRAHLGSGWSRLLLCQIKLQGGGGETSLFFFLLFITTLRHIATDDGTVIVPSSSSTTATTVWNQTKAATNDYFNHFFINRKFQWLVC